MRFEVVTAFVLGAMLPVLETVRRGITHWTINFTTMFEDYVGGAVLLIGAWAAYQRKSWGALFLALAWGSILGLMTSSMVAQLEQTLRQTATEPHNLVVLLVKLLLWSVSTVSLVLAFRSAIQGRT